MPQVGLREDFKNGRWYERPGSDGEVRFEAVSSIIGSCNSKPWLADWAANLAADWAVTHLELLGTLLKQAGKEEAQVVARKAAERKRNRARDRGSIIHHIIEALLADTKLPDYKHDADGDPIDPDEVDEIEMAIDGFLMFVDDFGPVMVASEATVADPVLKVAGTMDTILQLKQLNDRLILIDAKSGNVLGAEMVAQLGAYVNMPEAWLPTGLIVPAPKVDGAAILHLRREHHRGHKLIEIPPKRLEWGYHWFLQMREQYLYAGNDSKLRGRVVYPAMADGSQPPPLLEDVEAPWTAAAGALLRNLEGVTRVDDLARFTAKQLLDVKNVGPKTVEAAAAMLAVHNLALRVT